MRANGLRLQGDVIVRLEGQEHKHRRFSCQMSVYTKLCTTPPGKAEKTVPSILHGEFCPHAGIREGRARVA